jgi:DNA modification methylase
MKTQEIDLFWHNYKFFPYEKRFALREIETLLKPNDIKELNGKLIISGSKNSEAIKKLVYFSHAEINQNIVQTLQFHCENGSGTIPRHKRQNTRYSVHGLHEYKGKFNPQVVRSLFNIYNIQKGDKVLDPFCGSGTTLVEAAHDNITAKGTDINPLAVFIANTKIGALNLSFSEVVQSKGLFFKRYSAIKLKLKLNDEDPRIQYLKSWFPEATLIEIEALRLSAYELEESIKNLFLVIISNTLREYSFQEPLDLRIRRRTTPLPTTKILDQVSDSIDAFAQNIKEFHTAFKPLKSNNKAHHIDIKLSQQDTAFKKENSFDFAITSPPYATALPYIDTQRLSLVWLNLISAKEIRPLESDLIGSREFKMKSEQLNWQQFFLENKHSLPKEIHSFCMQLNSKLKPSEGFRKIALPSLLYRYFYDMKLAFEEVHRLLKEEKYFCLIVGHNHTTIGGSRTDIDTPKLLSFIGKEVGFKIHEILPLEAYQRYGLNSLNAVQQESLIVFKK